MVMELLELIKMEVIQLELQKVKKMVEMAVIMKLVMIAKIK
jgi:hypothetical protein